MNSTANDRFILLVEDDPNDELLIRRALSKHDIHNEVVVARDGAEALAHLFPTGSPPGRERRALPAVVLLDLKLPRVDGLAVLRRLRQDEMTRGLPVVILTSSAEGQDITRGYDLGVNSFVRKPVNFDEFAETVRQLGVYWLLINEPPPRT